ncbi:MAG: hypothetical protein RL318_1979 [Fibrobacterota bacterium]|jgi:hypothetical protein
MNIPTLSRSELFVGDTVVLRWDLPAGAKLVSGAKPGDSLLVQPGVPGVWVLQPLAAGVHGGDTLRALVGQDTLSAVAPRFQARSRLESTQDTAISGLLAPEEMPVPFPWKEAGIGLAGIAVGALLLWAWLRHRRNRPKVEPVVAVPAVDPLVAAEIALQALEERAMKGLSGRETAFEAGEILRTLHRALFGFQLANESTSFEWKTWGDRELGPDGAGALRQFLSEADQLRYAGLEADAASLFMSLRGCLRAAAKERQA